MSDTGTRGKETQALALLRDRLIKTFDQIPADQVNAVIDQELIRFESAPVRDFVPLLVERLARDGLRHTQHQWPAIVARRVMLALI
ncbi:three-helix bundle dimerization domain-containing protein [Actinomadura scrupuli]|uniref:three-helix bundle dimerization domain-containing protein n=1 Tax=Actinomadura scrupuli TaxID=559629 RepID=UPI003D9979F0